MKQVTYITGNKNKAQYLSRLLGIDIPIADIDLDEVQSTDLKKVVEHKVKQAYKEHGTPVLVEDQALDFEALNGLPGPFVKWFVEDLGLEGMCRMLDGFNNRKARARSIFAYYDGDEVVYFEGGLDGEIVDHPIGENGWGWDPIFKPVGYDKTRGQMSKEEDDKTYQMIKPFKELRKFLNG